MTFAAETATGQGRTLVSRAFIGQGGGHVELDASGNYEIASARRSLVVDMQAREQVATVIAVRDHFADTSTHQWTWQLPIGPGVQRHRLPDESGMKAFVYRRDGGWMKGWVIPDDGQTVFMDRGTVKGLVVQGTSTSTTFRVLLALGRGTEPLATRSGMTISVAGRPYDLESLDRFGG